MKKKIDPVHSGRWDITCVPSVGKTGGDFYSRGLQWGGEQSTDHCLAHAQFFRLCGSASER